MSASNPHPPDEAGSRRTAGQVLKDIGLFFASPFVTMGCLALFPFIGLAELRRAWRHRNRSG